VHFWNKIENKINHRFAAIYNMGKKYNANKLEILIERRNPSNSELHP
jgi:hypothetical protein